ncbi:MAG: MBL fold metallo-hydrolase, partial [Clostridia bacterium]
KLAIFDLGSGSLINLQKKYLIEDISFIVLTHLHFDHMSDMLVLRYALQMKKMKMDVYLPRQPKNIAAILKCDEFNLLYIDESLIINRDSFTVKLKKTTHPVETYAVRVNDYFVYSADLAEPDDLLEFGYGADILLIDSAFLTIQKGNRKLFHLSASECGIIAHKLNVKKLILTHLPPESDIKKYKDEASLYFKKTELALVMQEY